MYDRRALNNLFLNSFLFFLEEQHIVFTEEHVFLALIRNERIEELFALCSLNFYEFKKKLDNFFDGLKLRKNYAPDDIFSIDTLYSKLLHETATCKNINSIHEKDLLWYLIVRRQNFIRKSLIECGFDLAIFTKLMGIHDYIGSDSEGVLSINSNDEYVIQYIHNNEVEMKKSFRDSLEALSALKDEVKINASNSTMDEDLFLAKDFLVDVVRDISPDQNPLVGREEDLNRLIQIILRKQKSNPMLVGEAGVGKTVLVSGLAYNIRTLNVPDDIRGYKIYSLDIGKLMSGTRYRGDLEERISNVLDFLISRDKVILFIDEIHMIVGAGSTSNTSLDIANLLKPILTMGNIKFIGATTNHEYRKYFAKDKALMRRFHKIEIKEPSFDEAFTILKGTKSKYEHHHHVTYTDDAIRAAITLSSKYMQDKFLPDKALDILDEVGSKFNLENKRRKITESDINDIFKSILGLGLFNFKEYDKNFLIDLENKIKQDMKIDDELLKDLILNIKLLNLDIYSKKGTLGIFVFIGLPGVGKTKLINILSEELKMPKIDINMNDYSEPEELSRLIGHPLGYMSNDEESKLANVLGKYSSSILVLSDFHKANKKAVDFFISGFKTGKLIDNMGKTVNLKENLVIVTINLENKDINGIGFNYDTEYTMDSESFLERRFPKSFLEIVDHIFFFKPLQEEDFNGIIMEELNKLIIFFKEKKVDLYYDELVVEYIKEKTYGVEFGRKNVCRFMEKEVNKLLIDKILFEEFKENDKIRLYFDGIIKYELL